MKRSNALRYLLLTLPLLLTLNTTTTDQDEATQQTVSTIVGALAGGGTGASTGLDGEKYNRQLHQREIAWIKSHAAAFAKANGLSVEEATARLTEEALRSVDKGWSLKLGSKHDKGAQAFLKQNDAHMFEVKSQSEFYDPTITRYGNTVTKITDLTSQEKKTLSEFYHGNTPNMSKESLKSLYIKDLKARGIKNAEEIWNGIKSSPQAIEQAYNYIKEHAKDITWDKTVDTAKAIGKGIKDHVKNVGEKLKDSAASSGQIARNTNGMADQLDDLYQDPTAHTAGRLMVDEDLASSTLEILGAAKGAATAIKGITKLPDGKVRVELEGGKSVEVPEWANDIGILRDIAKKKGNFGIGSTSAEKSNELGKAWVGDNYRVASDGKTLVSQDGLRTYRPPSKKPNSPYAETGIQSNFEEFFINSKGDKIKIRNAHMDIINE